MIAEFVERRGGGLLMLGGARSFSEGGYAGTPVADALPVMLERVARSLDAWPVSRLKVRPTRAGEGHALAQIAPTEAASLNRWNELPTLISVNAVKAREAGRDGAADRHRREARHPAGAGVSALRPRQGAGVHGARFLALADARQHSARGHDARELSGGSSCAGWSTACRVRSRCTRQPTASRRASRSRSPPTSWTTPSWRSTTRRWSAR